MRAARLYTACLVVGLFMALPRPAASQSYGFTRVLNGSTQRPDGLGVFYISYSRTTPAFDGKWVVFRDPGPQNDDGSHAAIWSFNTVDSTFHKLVDFNTSIPGGAANFHDIQLMDAAPSVRNGIVVFIARDTLAREGLYSVPAAGGPIAKIADRDTADPSGGTFTVFDASGKQMGGFSFDGTTVAFNATGSAMVPGDYWAVPDGSSLGLIADSLHPAQNGTVNGFYAPAISGSNVVMIGTDGAVNGTGSNGIYLGMAGGNGTLAELLNSGQQLPGNPNAGFHTRFDAPVLAFGGTLVAFHATDSNSGSPGNPAGFFGLFSTDLTSHTIDTIADVNSTLPGLGKLQAIAISGVAVSQGSVLFQATDTAGASGLYIWKNGAAARIIGSGDLLDGRMVGAVADPGPAALYGSSFAFVANFGPDRGLYVATPPPNVVTLACVTNAASYGASSIAPGEIVTLFGAGMGPPALTAYQFDANGRIPTLLSGVRILFGGTPAPLIYVSDKQSAAIVPFGIANLPSAEIRVEYNGNVAASITVPVTNTMPGLFSANYSGSGQGAIQNADASYNSTANPAAPGSVVVLWVAGLGQLNPAQADGSIVPLSTVSTLPTLQYPVTVTIGGQPAQIEYQGPAPLAVAGLYQINCVIPPGTPSGPAAVVVTADGRQSQPNLTLAVR